jgi:ankyrin repeat protein
MNDQSWTDAEREHADKLLLLFAIHQNDIETASKMLSSGTLTANDDLFLHASAVEGRLEIMDILLDAGANINAVNRRGLTSCHCAIQYDHFDALKLLVERVPISAFSTPTTIRWSPLLKNLHLHWIAIA